MGEPVMEQAIKAYHHITATSEFKEMERLRSLARHNEAAALRHAAEVEREKWQGVVAEQKAALAEHKAALAEHKSVIADKDAEHKAALADKDAEIAALRAQLNSEQIQIKN